MTVPGYGRRAVASVFPPPDCKVHIVVQVLGRHLCTIHLRGQAYNQPESSEAFVNTHCWWRSQCPEAYDIPYIMMTMLVLCQFWISSARQVTFMGQYSLHIWLCQVQCCSSWTCYGCADLIDTALLLLSVLLSGELKRGLFARVDLPVPITQTACVYRSVVQ